MEISPVTNQASSMSSQPLYDVFLSFRGPDTRWKFTDHLCKALKDAGILVYRDDQEVETGKEINEQLIEAIKRSKMSIPVLSKNYANSDSCLRELTQMLECKKERKHIIVPIFYEISPSSIRKMDLKRLKKRSRDDKFVNSWKNALNEIGQLKGHHIDGNSADPSSIRKEDPEGLKKRSRDGKLFNSWKNALNEIGQLKGHHLDGNSAESELISKIVYQVRKQLKMDLILTKHLVEVTPHVQRIMAMLKVDYQNGQAVNIGNTREMVLIHGISGVGKSVLAKCIYNKLHDLYDASSFLGNIQAEIESNGVVSVQNKLILELQKGNAPKFLSSDYALTHIKHRLCNMKVVVILDDVKDYAQLVDLVGEPDWFGLGSRVIVTSQRGDLLHNISGATNYLLRPMKQDDALKLFCRHAFGTDSPRKGFIKLSSGIVNAAGGIPLTLELVGSDLKPAKKKIWKETLELLQRASHESVRRALEKSYNNLNENERQIFLDIACFFTGNDKRIPSYMWADCEYLPAMSIRSLQTRCLLEIGEDKELRMHETLKKFGREMVKKENKKLFKRSRLYDHNDALKVLQSGKGTGKVQGLRLEFGDRSEGTISFQRDQFKGLQELRFLKLGWADIRGHFGDRLSSLRWLIWQGCPKSSDVQALNLNFKNLVVLDLSWSQVDREWQGWKLLLKEAEKLKVLKLIGCVQLSATPNFPLSMQLERLFLEGCSKLAVIDRSFGNLKKLVSLNVKGCSLLRELPDFLPMRGLKELVIEGTSISRIDFREGSMKNLKVLSARNCKGLTEITDSISCLKSLKYLALDGTAIKTLRNSIVSLEKLETLSLKNCEELTGLPQEIGNLTSLQFLDLSYTDIRTLPRSVNKLKALQVLRMRRTFIEEFPEDILNLEKLEEIDFSLCRSLKGTIHCDIWRLSSLAILNLSKTQISGLPESFSRLSGLQRLDISGCHHLQSLPEMLSTSIISDDD